MFVHSFQKIGMAVVSIHNKDFCLNTYKLHEIRYPGVRTFGFVLVSLLRGFFVLNAYVRRGWMVAPKTHVPDSHQNENVSWPTPTYHEISKDIHKLLRDRSSTCAYRRHWRAPTNRTDCKTIQRHHHSRYMLSR